MAIACYLDRRTFTADYPTVCHKPKAGPMTRTISHANTNNPIPIHAPLVLVWTNASDCEIVNGSHGKMRFASAGFWLLSFRRFASPIIF
jgi:hypothetical protein